MLTCVNCKYINRPRELTQVHASTSASVLKLKTCVFVVWSFSKINVIKTPRRLLDNQYDPLS